MAIFVKMYQNSAVFGVLSGGWMPKISVFAVFLRVSARFVVCDCVAFYNFCKMKDFLKIFV